MPDSGGSAAAEAGRTVGLNAGAAGARARAVAGGATSGAASQARLAGPHSGEPSVAHRVSNSGRRATSARVSCSTARRAP